MARQNHLGRFGGDWWLGAVPALLAGAVYANSLRNGFALDDETIVATNDAVHDLAKLPHLLVSPYWPGVPIRMGLYRPLTMVSFAFDWTIGGGHPWLFHAVNVLLHVVVTFLIFVLLRRLGARPWAAAIGSALFAVHPVHVEAVANVVGRSELLSALFYLGACLLYLDRTMAFWPRIVGIAVCALLAISAKEIAVMLPATLILLEGFRPDRLPGSLVKRIRDERWAIVAAVAGITVFLLARLAVLGTLTGTDVDSTLSGLSTASRLATVARIWPEYVRLLFYPRDLVSDYSPGVIATVTWRSALAGLGVVIVVAGCAIAILARRRAPLVAAGIIWFGITIFPVSNLVIPVGVVLAERTLYWPSVAVALIGAGLATVFATRGRRVKATGVGLVGIALVCGVWRTWSRNPVWASTEMVGETLANEHPESAHGVWYRGLAAIDAGRVGVGLGLLQQSVRLVPGHWRYQYMFGDILARYNQIPLAEEAYRRAIALIPEMPQPYLALNLLLLQEGKPHDVIDVAHQGARFDSPLVFGFYDQLASAYSALGDWKSALTARQTSIRLAGPVATSPQWRSLAQIQSHLGNAQAADEASAKARELEAREPKQIVPEVIIPKSSTR